MPGEIILRYIFTVCDKHNACGAYYFLLFAQMLRNKLLMNAESE